MDVGVALRNLLLQLQADPGRYKLFGVYWWPVKALLKRAGYTTANLYMLGDYHDAAVAALVPKAGLTATLEAAFAEYGANARYPHPGGMVEDPDGDMVAIYDEDAGI